MKNTFGSSTETVITRFKEIPGCFKLSGSERLKFSIAGVTLTDVAETTSMAKKDHLIYIFTDGQESRLVRSFSKDTLSVGNVYDLKVQAIDGQYDIALFYQSASVTYEEQAKHAENNLDNYSLAENIRGAIFSNLLEIVKVLPGENGIDSIKCKPKLDSALQKNVYYLTIWDSEQFKLYEQGQTISISNAIAYSKADSANVNLRSVRDLTKINAVST